ncbi:unnamed protein product [Miscanthus lutarioriparius]|uniref:MBD domain-containing protein n=1 Tax=Miscanthus lutarioriparius TaxID=422564 RepID=A0A811R743_9POAL|nr:unnamed protein product [Miscanthus lutarioriparius]
MGRTRSGLVRKKGIFALSRASCSRTRSGLLRVKSFVDSSDVSSSRTRSGLLRIKRFVESRDGSCSMSQSDHVRGSPPIVEAIINDEAVLKESPDGLMKEEMPSRTQNGLVRQSSADKADESGTRALPNGCLSEDMPSRTRSGLVRRSPTVKTLSKDKSVIKGLAEGSLKEDTPLGTRSGLVRGSLAAKVPIKAELVTKGQPDGWMKNDKVAGTRSGLGSGRLAAKASKFLTENLNLGSGRLAAKTVARTKESLRVCLMDGEKEYRPRKSSSFQDLYYIDPVSGYEVRSLKDVHHYLETGDIRQCAVRPKKSTTFEVHMTESQTHTSASSQHTRPGTADKGIQCEILTSDGIMVPWEELITPYNGNDTEHTVLPEPESLKASQGYGNKLDTSEHMSVQPVFAHNGSRQTKSVKRKEPNAEVKSKKRKTSSAVTPVRASPRLAALNVQLEVSIEHEDEIVSINHVDRVQTIEESAIDQTQKSQSGSVDQIHGNLESTFSQLQLSQADTANGVQAIQENTTIHSQPSQLDTLNPTQKKQENSANQLQSVLTDSLIPKQITQECTIDQPSQPDIDHVHTDQEFTGNQFQSSLPADTVISLGDIEECTACHSQPSNTDTTGQIQANEENTADQVQLSLADTVILVPAIQEYATGYSQLSKADTTNQTQANQEYIADQVQSSLTDTVIPVQGIEEYTTDYSHISKADITNQIQTNQENTDDHLYLSQVDCATQMQIIEENLSKQPQLSQSETGDRIQIDLESTTNHLQPNYDENSMLQSGFSWAPEQNGGAPITDFWKNVETQASSVSMPINGVPVASFPANVRFHNAAAAEPALPPQVAPTETGSDQPGLAFQSLFGNIWSDPCIEFAFKTLTGDIPVLDDTTAVTDYFPEQQDLNKGQAPNCAGSVFDNNSRNHTQVDVNLPPPTPDDFYNGSWFPPQ